MKCKKLFAMLLSLCMIASAFVAVSAEEQYMNDTRLVAEVGSNFDAGTGAMHTTDKTGGKITVENVDDPRGNGGQVLKITATGVTSSTANNFLIGFQITDANGTNVAEFVGKKFKYNLDFMFETDADAIPVDTGNSGLWIRGGFMQGGNIPQGPFSNVKQFSTTLHQPGNWYSFSGELIGPDNFVSQGMSGTTQRPYTFYLRPNFKADGVLYIDDMSVTVTETLTEAEWVPTTSPMLTASAAKNGADVTMTLTNANEGSVKLSGTLFIAEYNGDQLVQFASEPLAETTFEAGGDGTVTASFASVPSGTVKAFLWDTATLAPHYFAPDVQ